MTAGRIGPSREGMVAARVPKRVRAPREQVLDLGALMLAPLMRRLAPELRLPKLSPMERGEPTRFDLQRLERAWAKRDRKRAQLAARRA